MAITDQHTLDMWRKCRWTVDIIDLKGWLVSVDGLDLSWWRGSADLVCAGLRSTLLAHCPLLTPAAQLTLSSGCCVKSLFWRIEGSQIDFEGLLYFCELRARAFWSQNKGMVWLGGFSSDFTLLSPIKWCSSPSCMWHAVRPAPSHGISNLPFILVLLQKRAVQKRQGGRQRCLPLTKIHLRWEFSL